MLKKIPIRYKMTLFYLLLTCVLLALFLPLLFFTTENVLRSNQEDLLRLSVAQLSAQIESEDGTMVLENDPMLSQVHGYAIWHLDGGLVAHRQMPDWAEALPFEADVLREERRADGTWLVLDGMASEDGVDMRVRAVLSLVSVQNAMAAIRTACMISIPLFLLASFFGGLWIARRSLRPIDRVISTTKKIARGDLSERIQGVQTRDEVGELATVMNQMLENVEASFRKEKRFASDASHELRTPVAIIMAYAESLLEEPGMEAEDAGALLAILQESRHMERIIAQLLMLSRGQEHRYPFERESLEMEEIIDSVAAQLEPLAAQKRITLVPEVSEDATLLGDQSLITQMLLNVVENSIKYGKQGGITHIRAQEEGGRLRIQVADDGIGIAKEHLPQLFERFFRVDASRDRSGSGLGLSIVQWIVDMHQGRIEVESEPGRGTVFTIWL